MVKYTLIMVDSDNRKHRISFYNPNTGKNENRTELSNIDRNTTRFHNPDELFEYIKGKHPHLKGYNKFYISYKYKEPKKLKTAFYHNENVRKLAQVADVNIDKSSHEFLRHFNRLLYLIEKKGIRDYLLDSPEIDEKLKEYIDTRVNLRQYSELYVTKIKNKLSNYKVTRDLLFVLDEYNEKLKKINAENTKILESQKCSDGTNLENYKPAETELSVEPANKVKVKKINYRNEPYPNQLSLDDMFNNKF